MSIRPPDAPDRAASPFGALRRNRPLAADLVEALSSRIRGGEWEPGQQIPTEPMLEAEYGVSRTVIREAVSRLQATGLLQVERGRGTFVSDPRSGQPIPFRVEQDQLEKVSHALAVLELRMGIETAASELAAARRTQDDLKAMEQALAEFEALIKKGDSATAADYQFHLLVCRATHNDQFVAVFGALGGRAILRGAMAAHATSSRQKLAYAQRVADEHRAVFLAIKEKDAGRAAAAMRTHLLNTRLRLQKAPSVTQD